MFYVEFMYSDFDWKIYLLTSFKREKMENYQNLKREIGRLWKLKMVEGLPVVIRALGSVTKEFDGWIEKLGITNNVGVMQKGALLGTERILRKVLEM